MPPCQSTAVAPSVLDVLGRNSCVVPLEIRPFVASCSGAKKSARLFFNFTPHAAADRLGPPRSSSLLPSDGLVNVRGGNGPWGPARMVSCGVCLNETPPLPSPSDCASDAVLRHDRTKCEAASWSTGAAQQSGAPHCTGQIAWRLRIYQNGDCACQPCQHSAWVCCTLTCRGWWP